MAVLAAVYGLAEQISTKVEFIKQEFSEAEATQDFRKPTIYLCDQCFYA